MTDLLRCLSGDAGPRIGRETIKKDRIVCTVVAIAWLAGWIALFFFLGDMSRQEFKPAIACIVGLLLTWTTVCNDIETQIRHLNGLALSPAESLRMTPRRVALMWIGDAMIFAAFLDFAVTLLLTTGSGRFALGIGVIILAAGVLLGLYSNGFASLFSSRYIRYDPNEDE